MKAYTTSMKINTEEDMKKVCSEVMKNKNLSFKITNFDSLELDTHEIKRFELMSSDMIRLDLL